MVNREIPVVSQLSGSHNIEAEDIVNIWARNSGKRMAVRIPPGCLLVQAGKQLEWASGGLIKGMSKLYSHLYKVDDSAGFHEVICNAQTLEVRISWSPWRGRANN
jgi:hypothetical protein